MKTMGVWNAKILYRNVWNLSMVLYGYLSRVVWDLLSFVWKSIEVCTIVWVCLFLGYRKYKYTIWRLPNSFLVRVELRRVLRLL